VREVFIFELVDWVEIHSNISRDIKEFRIANHLSNVVQLDIRISTWKTIFGIPLVKNHALP
jgi:hypothetical protein